ncbi:39S ribosomal protein L1, mitochondrial [Trichinella sp. T8]|uniref:39S ribosomal protein L1, mitochondrial n=1 Tax=Trichinella murrelli TaxID=144512 RepID=A0A0V0TJF3_9BILA|nr:39S ribosomal protein L1, mitochondrial [Trichinella murrelli]KRZ97642.1 39S ribosomal protein L1, mitochondrial [Trichinella sp. T8]
MINSLLLDMFSATLPMLITTRGAKRRGVQALRKLKEAKLGIKTKVVKKERASSPITTTNSSIAAQYPARVELLPDLLDEPLDSVWKFQSYMPKRYFIKDALALHRELQSPSMYNNPSALLRLRLDLNMTLEKKTKFVEQSKQFIAMPHPFDHGQKRTILAFAKDPHIQVIANEAGAEITVEPLLVDDHLCAADSERCCSNRRYRLQRLPFGHDDRDKSTQGSAIGSDIAALVNHFRTGIGFEVIQDAINPQWGVTNVLIGKLDMPDDDLEENMKAVIQTVYPLRSPALGPFIERAVLMVVPTVMEYFEIDLSPYLPEPTDEDEQDGDDQEEQMELRKQ